MAAEVPAKDVLCEAMEYLSKLGSNLRTRSDNLREKKIRREKLNNVLAVQKAASKVLLICELSKKSLDNVETGVRKVLELIDTSQASSSDGRKKAEIEKNSDNTPKYFFFEYKSRKLRIKKRISLKHYTSVRVMAKCIPKSMMENYPVHYDCKLYRMRKRERKTQDLSKDSECNNEKDTNVASPVLQHKINLETHEKSERNQIPNEPRTSTLDSAVSIDRSKINSFENEEQISCIDIPKSPSSISDADKNVNTSECIDKKKRRKSSTESIKQKSYSKESVKQLDKLKLNDKEKGCSVKNRSAEESQREHRKSSHKSDNNEDGKKKYKKLRVTEDSQDEENSKTNSENSLDENVKEKNEGDVSYHEPAHKKRKLNENVGTEESLHDENKAAKNEEQDGDEDDEAVKDSKKPVIKCVSLSKLLKPDILMKKEVAKPNSLLKDGRLLIDSKNNHKADNTKNDKIAEKSAKKKKEEEEYWIKKRNEVSSFIPKSFIINITRLPEFTIEYLNILSLRKITQSGVTIVEIDNEILNETDRLKDKDETETVKSKERKGRTKIGQSKEGSSRASSKSSNSDDDDLIAEANKVKNSLLVESESDDNGIGSDNVLKSTDEAYNVKMALLNDSDLETKNSDDGLHSVSENKTDKDATKVRAVSNVSASEPVHKSASAQTKKGKNNLENSDSDSGKNEANTINEEGESMLDEPIQKDIEDSKKKDPEKNDENLSECQINEKTPEKTPSLSGDCIEKAKSSLLNDSSDDKTRTPLSQRMTTQSRKKRIRESMHAKKMLLSYSSSETEDEQLKEALKEIKDALLHVSDEEKSSNEQEQKSLSRESSSLSSDEILNKVKKKITYDSSSSKEKEVIRKKRRKLRRRLDSQDNIRTENSDSSKLSSRKVRSKK